MIIGAALQERLSSAEACGITPRPEVIEAVREWLQHCRVRHNLPHNFTGRLSLITRELLTLRYHRYSAGFFSVAKDLVVR